MEDIRSHLHPVPYPLANLSLCALLLAVACRSSAERVFELAGNAPAFVGLVEAPGCAVSVNDLGAATCIGAGGQVLWRADVCRPVRQRPAIIGGTLWVACENGEWHGLDVKSGRSRWKQPGRRAPVAALASDGLRGFIAGTGAMVEAIDETGASLWVARGSPPLWAGADAVAMSVGDAGVEVDDVHGTPLWSDPRPAVAIAGTDALVIAARASGDLAALDARTGEPRWGVTLGAFTPDSLSVDGERVFVGLQSGALVELSVEGGVEKSRTQLPAPLAAPVRHGVAVLQGREGCALMLAAGRTVCVDHQLRGSAVVNDGILMLGPRDGRVLGFRLAAP